ncbi:MAG TPA: hypothetical protein VGN72_00190 [Tepidisphaeraceae bacterium]|jgi:hypothetical protein|nr:hypothetical protein [Tepidisphaeraceae bacterium]
MSSKKTLEVEIRGRDGISAEAKKAGASADALKRKLAEVNAAAANVNAPKSSLDDRLKGVGNKLGEDDAVGKVLKGGLVGFAGEGLANVTGKAIELRDALRDGKTDAAGLTQSLLESLPIIGGFATAGKNIRELITGEQAEIDKINAGAKLQKSLIDYRLGLLKQQQKLQKEIAESVTQANQRRKLATTDNDAERADLQQQFDSRAKLKGISTKRDDAVTAVEDQRKQQVEAVINDDTLDDEQKQTAKASINRAAEEQVVKIRREYAEVERAEIAAQGAEVDKLRQEHADKAAGMIEKYSDETASLEVQQRADRLKALGKDLEAELLLVDENAKAKRKAIEKQLEEQLKTAPAFIAEGLKANATIQINTIERGVEEKKQTLVKQQLEDIRTRQLTQQAAAGNRSAELELKRLETIKSSRQEYERLTTIIETQQAILDNPAATPEQRQAAEQAKRSAQEGIKGQAVTQQMAVTEQIKQQRKDILEQVAESSTSLTERTTARRQIEAESIRDEFRRRQVEVTEFSKNPNATAEQKNEMTTMLQQWVSLQGKAFDTAVAEEPPPQRSGKFEIAESRTLTGVTAAMSEKASTDWTKATSKHTEESKKLQKELNKMFGDYLVEYRQRGQTQGITLTAGVLE